jgi:predicted O-linked N-acetylglucosamine transferase (SPINDLY family)
MNTASDLLTVAIQHHQSGRLDLAELIYRQILRTEPNHADALHLLGVIAHQSGNSADSIGYIERAIQLNGDSATAYSNLGIAYQALCQTSKAIDCFRRSLKLNPNDAQTHLNLGVALKSQGKLDDAINCYREAIRLQPDCAEAHNNLGIELQHQGQWREAIACHRHALELMPGCAEVHNNLGNALNGQQQRDEAIASFQRAIEIQPNYPEAFNNLANALKDQGRLDEAVECFRRAIELNPEFVVAHSNLIYTQLFCPDLNRHEILAEHCRWSERHALPLKKLIERHTSEPIKHRRLRIGYVSPDFRDHCQAFFTTPLFRNHDHTQFEIVCYSDVARADNITNQLRQHIDLWRNIVGLNDEQVATLIRQDKIDILVDLTMHMAGNRLLVFARKPAPVQVSWLAYPGTTGLNTIDYRLTDHFLDPPDQSDGCYTEESIRLPDTFWCYDPLTEKPDVSALPATKNDFLTFGCLNNFCKVNPQVLKLWARVLKSTDRSRLIVLSAEGRQREGVLSILATEGVTGDRVSFVSNKPRRKYLNYYHDIDIGLDTFPYNGHTTSLDSFWMGVPVVTLVGSTVVGRAGVSQLMNLGLPDLIAASPDQFVAIAMALANDLPRLRILRASLRHRIQKSPLMDAQRFARNIEAAYREMWQRWRNR